MIEPSERVGVAIKFDALREVLLDCVGTRVGSVATRTVVWTVPHGLFPSRLERRIF